MALPRLYDDLAWLWPYLSPPEHYEAEAALLEGLIRQRLGDGPKRILELGAGGGHTLVHFVDTAPGNLEEVFEVGDEGDGDGELSASSDILKETPEDVSERTSPEVLRKIAGGDSGEASGGRHCCVAVDLSEPMLAHCRALIPGIATHVGDMRSVRLGELFDVVLIHDAVDYLLTPEDVALTLQTVREHLVPGGLAMIAPTYTTETFVDGDVADDSTTAESRDVTYFSYVHDPDPADTTFEMILLYLIRRPRPRKFQRQERSVLDGASEVGVATAEGASEGPGAAKTSGGDSEGDSVAGGEDEGGRCSGEAMRGNSPRHVEVIEDRHTCGLFGHEAWLTMMREAGFEAEFIEQGEEEDQSAWVLFLGTVPSEA